MNTHWVTEPTGYVEPKITKEGQASIPARTIIEVFSETVEKHGNRPAMLVKRPVNGILPDDWKTWTWQDYWNDCRKFAKTLVQLNVDPYKVINVIGFNSPEWYIANCGAIMASSIVAGIYTSNSVDACEYVTTHCKAQIVVVEGNKQLLKYERANSRFPNVKAMVVYGEAINEEIAQSCGIPVYPFTQFMELGSNVPDSALDARLASVRPGNCATLIYTSGTTGKPKGCMISHDSITWMTKALCDCYIPMGHADRCISYLPLSHIAAQIIDIHTSMYLGSSIYFAQPDALKGSLTKTLKEVKPTYFFGVPRVWEKIHEKMVGLSRDNSALMKAISSWAKSIGTEHSRLAQYENRSESGPPCHPCAYTAADLVVFSKVKAALGLDKCKACFTAAAPISESTLNYFGSLDIPVLEMYGTSESTGPHTTSAPDEWKIGYCGRPLPGALSRLESTGELSIYGRHVFMGYLYMEEKTAATFDKDGYLYTGDIAAFDKNDRPEYPKPSGFMKIIGRMKDLIITAGGENVPPAIIEHHMKTAMVAVSNCLVVGDRRPYLTMFVTLKSRVNHDTGEPTDELAKDSLFVAKQIGSTATTVSEAIKDPLWKKYIDDGMEKGNASATSAAQIVKKWTLLPVDFSEKAGDLTPTLKVKRNVVAAKVAQQTDEMYAK